MRVLVRMGLVIACLGAGHTAAFAQAALSGVVKDSSGGLLPGVTVEAASPALIEKVRTAVTDGTGRYRIESLQPGEYSVTFTLPGFVTLKREGVTVSGTAVIAVDAEMRVGGVQETITVTGEAPVVDVQSTKREITLDNETIRNLPSVRSYSYLLTAVPGLQPNITDVNTGPVFAIFPVHGGRGVESRLTVDGLNISNPPGGNQPPNYTADIGNSVEVTVMTAGGLGEFETAGVQMNIVPKQGGNRMSGLIAGSGFSKDMQSNNFSADLQARGAGAPNPTYHVYDFNVAVGGPILKDKLWYYMSVRQQGSRRDILNVYYNTNAGDPSKWSYAPDFSKPGYYDRQWENYTPRITWQASQRNKFTFSWDEQPVCRKCTGTAAFSGTPSSTTAPEADGHGEFSPQRVQTARWTSPVTNKLLLEAAFSQFFSNWSPTSPAGALNYEPFIPVQERSLAGGVPVPNMVYHGYAGLSNNHQTHNVWRASAAYVTGSHSMKVGYQAAYEVTDIFGDFPTHGLQYRFNAGVPDQITQRITKWQQANRTRWDAFYVQDQWTRHRLTLQGALRYEHAWSFFPEGMNGLLTDSRFGGPARTLPRADGVTGYHDVAPRMGMAYDVFGTGKTAVKVNLSKYWQYAANDGVYIGTNPASTFAQTANRAWNDRTTFPAGDPRNGNYVPDCDLMNPAANGECAALDNQNFFVFRQTGNALSTATRIDPALLSGWGVRPYDWQFSTSVQQELLPRVSAEFGFSRRWWGNFTVTDNRAIGPEDFDTYTFTAPSDPRLPTSGQSLSYILRNNRTAFGAVDNYLTLASNYGDVTAYWQGVDMTVNARVREGFTVQGGFTAGAGTRDFCDVASQLPELYATVGSILLNAPTTPVQQASTCRIEEPWLWAWRGLGSYIVPKVDVQISAIMRSQPNVTATNDPASNGQSLNATYFQTNAAILAALGRPIAGGAPTVALDLARPGDVYPHRLNTVDMRFTKIVRIGRTRTNVGVDLYNLFNANTGITFNQNFGTDGSTWLRPNAILNPRYVRFNATIDF